MRMARACIKCCTPHVFPQTWIWGRHERKTVCICNHRHDNSKWGTVSLANLKEVCSPLANSSRTAQKMTQQVQIFPWSSNMQQDCHLESGPEPCEQTKNPKHTEQRRTGGGKWHKVGACIPICPTSDGCRFETGCHPGLYVWSWTGRWRLLSGAEENKAGTGCQKTLSTNTSKYKH